jgi:hypothetical protein
MAGDDGYVSFVSILLQKSKIEELRKSRESLLFDVFVAAGPRGIDTAAGGRFGAKRCGSSRRRVQNTPASLKNFKVPNLTTPNDQLSQQIDRCACDEDCADDHSRSTNYQVPVPITSRN